MARFWVSWYQPTEDYRPIHYPPRSEILGWWCSGSGDDYWTLCALVEATDQESAEAAIEHEWPEVKDRDDWRFWNDVEDDYIPGNRFPLPDWSPLVKKGS